MESKNFDLLEQFITYCEDHPEQRFWQALRNWSGQQFILTGKGDITDPTNFDYVDTFYWEGLDK